MDIKVIAAQFKLALIMASLSFSAYTLHAMEQKEADGDAVMEVPATQDSQPPTGLVNLGNTCFVNATLQCLFEPRGLNDHPEMTTSTNPLIQRYLQLKNNPINDNAIHFINAAHTAIPMVNGRQ